MSIYPSMWQPYKAKIAFPYSVCHAVSYGTGKQETSGRSEASLSVSITQIWEMQTTLVPQALSHDRLQGPAICLPPFCLFLSLALSPFLPSFFTFKVCGGLSEPLMSPWQNCACLPLLLKGISQSSLRCHRVMGFPQSADRYSRVGGENDCSQPIFFN